MYKVSPWIIILIAILVISIILCSCNNNINYEENNNINFKKNEKNTIVITLYHADWCKHCQNLKPKWNDLVRTLNDENINIRDVEVSNLDNEPEEIKKMIVGFPTVIVSPENKSYIGEHEIVNLLTSMVNTDISNNDISKNIIPGYDTITLYYANWCSFSKMLLPDWFDMKVKFVDNKIPVNLIEIEEGEITEHIVNSYPTAIRSSDNSKYVGKTEILKLLSSYFDSKPKNTMIFDENIIKHQEINDKLFNQQITNQNTIISEMNNQKESETQNNNIIYNDTQQEINDKIFNQQIINLNKTQEPVMIGPMDTNSLKTSLIFIYSINCAYSRMILPKWQKYKTDNNNKYNIIEIESANLDKYPEIKKHITGFPTLIVNDKMMYIGYDEINNILDKL